MNLHELATKTARVRDLQKRYFKYKDSATLTECKRAERELDEILNSILPKPIDPNKQKTIDWWSG